MASQASVPKADGVRLTRLQAPAYTHPTPVLGYRQAEDTSRGLTQAGLRTGPAHGKSPTAVPSASNPCDQGEQRRASQLNSTCPPRRQELVKQRDPEQQG